MDFIKEAVEFFTQFKDNTVSVFSLLFTASFFILLYVIIEFVEIKVQRKRQFNIISILCRYSLSLAVSLLIQWIFGSTLVIQLLSLILAIPLSFLVKEKYFSFLDVEISTHNRDNTAELIRLKKLFKDNPYYSIVEVLLYYGYISPVQKELVETNNIFSSPDEIAKEFLTLSVLTENQLKEAKAIMNIIRREGKILTKEEALLEIAKLEGGVEHEVSEN